MRHFAIVTVLAVITALAPHVQAYPEVDSLVEMLKPIIQGTDWELSSDWRSVTLVRRHCEFLNPVSLPLMMSQDQVWREYGFVTDYRISITFETKLTDNEYRQLWKLKRRLIAERTKDVSQGTKDFAAKSAEASKVMHLPRCKSDRFSIYMYSSQDDFFEVRPKGVQKEARAILQLLDKKFVSYKMEIPNE